ncbi:related to Pwp2p [Cephalotrichum gorgonifer]|uniref:Related to Pwp2p n=1 Tax=Cephalotrichum gorgonifer TaxID=2041049 RepID=A0AAE8N5V2_9PEZI|nr:related to Pwp2p [Cephalotrichum gorgonifer]
MATPIEPLRPVKAPLGPSPLSVEQRYWKSFKNHLLIPSPTGFAVTSISHPGPSTTLSQPSTDAFAVTSGTRIQLYSVRTRKLTKTITRFQDVARSGDIRRDGRVLVAGEDTGRIQVFDMGSRAILKTWDMHKQPVWVTKFSPTDLTRVLSASDDKTVRLLDLPSGDVVNTFVGHGDYVRCANFIPGSMAHLVASGSYDSTVRLWDPRAGTNSAIMTFKHADPVEAVLPMASGTMLLAASGSSVSVLDMVAGRPLQMLSNHQKTVTCLDLASGGRRVISGGLDGHVKVYETTGWNVVSTSKYPAPILSLRMVGSGAGADQADRHLVVGMSSGVLSIRTRLSSSETAKAKEREKGMDAMLAGDLASHDAKVAKRKRLASDKKKLDMVGEGADVVIAPTSAQKTGKERPWQKKLRHGQSAAALDEVLANKSFEHGPVNVLTLLLTLRHRGIMREALEGRDENSVQPILRWVCNHIFDTRYVSICNEVGMHLLELYSDYIGYSAELREGFRTLHRRVKVEVERAQVAWETSGALESLMNGVV